MNNDELKNMEANNTVNGNVGPTPSYDDIEVLDMDDTPAPEAQEVADVKPMDSIPPIEDVLGENVQTPEPKKEETVAPTTANPLPSIEDVLGTSEVKPEVQATPAEPQKVEENHIPSLDEMFGANVTAPAPEKKEEAPVSVETPAPAPEAATVPPVTDVFGVSEPKVETPATPVAEPSAPIAEPTTMNAKEEEVVSKLENTDMTPTKEEKKEELENTILLNKQLNDAKMAIKAEEAKKDPEKKNKNGLMLVIALFTVLIVAVVVIPFIFNYLNN